LTAARRRRRASTCQEWLGAALAALLVASADAAQAGTLSPALCDVTPTRSASQQDVLLRFAAVAREELERSDRRVALVARSGLNLARFDIRYSHAGVSLRASDNGPWSVRQLYFACAEGRPRLFDQGLPGFVLGTDDPALGYLSIVLLPPDAAGPERALERSALDKPLALRLLAGRYSANAYAFDLRYQNCNQWVAELLASAWGEIDLQADAPRSRAQQWLASAGYEPTTVEVRSHALMFAALFIPWLHTDDHPADDVAARRFRISLPTTIEAFVHARWPDAERIELCHDARQVVVRHGWTPITDSCRAEPGDRVVTLD
jgi:hypothetical protein